MSPDAEIRSLSWFGRSQRPGGHVWSQIELPAQHRRHFGGLHAALGQEAFPMSSLVPATGLCALSRFQDYPVLDSEENSLIHKQGSLARKEP